MKGVERFRRHFTRVEREMRSPLRRLVLYMTPPGAGTKETNLAVSLPGLAPLQNMCVVGERSLPFDHNVATFGSFCDCLPSHAVSTDAPAQTRPGESC